MPLAHDGINGIQMRLDLNAARAAVELLRRLATMGAGAARTAAEDQALKLLKAARQHVRYQEWVEQVRALLGTDEQAVFNNLLSDSALTAWIDP